MSGEFRYKQALIVRLDLDMGRGKIAVQCSHAAVSATEQARTRFPEWYKAWMTEGQAKIALKITELVSLLELEKSARRFPFPTYLVRDRGITQVPPGEITCLGIGPAPALDLDRLTGKLSLL